MLLTRQTKFINYINVFDGIVFPRVVTRRMLTTCYVTSVNPEFGMALARRLNQSRVCAVLQSNLIEEDRSTAWSSSESYYINYVNSLH